MTKEQIKEYKKLILEIHSSLKSYQETINMFKQDIKRNTLKLQQKRIETYNIMDEIIKAKKCQEIVEELKDE